MITAEQLPALIKIRAPELNSLARANGYKGPAFSSCKFLGITNGGQFCYQVTYFDETLEGEVLGKVFLTYNHTADQVTADF